MAVRIRSRNFGGNHAARVQARGDRVALIVRGDLNRLPAINLAVELKGRGITGLGDLGEVIGAGLGDADELLQFDLSLGLQVPEGKVVSRMLTLALADNDGHGQAVLGILPGIAVGSALLLQFISSVRKIVNCCHTVDSRQRVRLAAAGRSQNEHGIGQLMARVAVMLVHNDVALAFLVQELDRFGRSGDGLEDGITSAGAVGCGGRRHRDRVERHFIGVLRLDVLLHLELNILVEVIHIARREFYACALAVLLIFIIIVFIYDKGAVVGGSKGIGDGAVLPSVVDVAAHLALFAIQFQLLADLHAGRLVGQQRSGLVVSAVGLLHSLLGKESLSVRTVVRIDTVNGGSVEVRDHVFGDLIGRRDSVHRIDRGILIARAVAVGVNIGMILRREREGREIRVHPVAPDSQGLSDLIGDIDRSSALLLDHHRHGSDRRSVLAEDCAEGILQCHAGDLIAAFACILGGIRNHVIAVHQTDADLPSEGNRLGIGIAIHDRQALVLLHHAPYIGRRGVEIRAVVLHGLAVLGNYCRGILHLVENVELGMQGHHIREVVRFIRIRDRVGRTVVADEDINREVRRIGARGNGINARLRIPIFAELETIGMRLRQISVGGNTCDNLKFRILQEQAGRQLELQVCVLIIIIEGFGTGIGCAGPVLSLLQLVLNLIRKRFTGQVRRVGRTVNKDLYRVL